MCQEGRRWLEERDQFLISLLNMFFEFLRMEFLHNLKNLLQQYSL